MLGRRDVRPKKTGTSREKMSQLGFIGMDIDDLSNPADDVDDGDDSDLEAELAALVSDGKKPARRAPPPPIPAVNLDKMVEESMRDDDDVEVNSDDENDPELLSELNDLASDDEKTEEVVNEEKEPSPTEQPDVGSGSVIKLLEERLKMYQEAESKAKAAGEAARARRFTRGINTLQGQLKAVRSGRAINEDDIPPVVSVTVHGSAPAPAPTPAPAVAPELAPGSTPFSQSPEPQPESPVVQDEQQKSMEEAQISLLEKRRDEYRHAAVLAKRKGDKSLALGYAKIVKQFDIVISNVKSGQEVDLTEMPPPPPAEVPQATPPAPAEVPAAVPQEEDSHQTSAPVPEPVPAPSQPAADVIPTPRTVLEALMQRLEVFQKQQSKAEEENNGPKVRRMGRIVKQYQDAIKLHQKGKPIPVDELPTPPGYPPIPVAGAAPAPAAAPSGGPRAAPPLPPRPVPKPVSPPSESVAGPSGSNVPQPPPRSGSRGSTSSSDSTSKAASNTRRSPSSRQEKQLALLLARQREYKIAALQAKSTDMEKAKEYLRIAKRFEPLIEATNSGLPIDMKTVPASLKAKQKLESDFTLVSVEDCLPGTDDEVYKKLLLDLAQQAKTCITTRDHFKKVGDVPHANQFENLAVSAAGDLTALKNAYQRRDPLPKFHYENRQFNILRCNTDLTDNELELNIIQGINYNVPNPKDVDTYVRFEFPWPSEEPVKDKTPLVKDTNNPEYNAKYTLQIQRNARACQRMFKRHAIKCEVWSRGGFLRSDTLIGTASVKLQPLETVCEIHDSFDLLEGRKQVGGKLEIKVRVRNPIVSKQVEQMALKWLVIDHL